MDKKGLIEYIEEYYGAEPEYLWTKYPEYCIFRHASNRKWFALFLTVPRDKLGLSGDSMMDVLNVKCGSTLLGSLLETKGFLPAYHMNKSNWVTVLLDGSVPNDEIIGALDISYSLTKGKAKKS